MAVGRVKMGWAAARGADLSFQEAAMRREGDIVGVAGPAMNVHNNHQGRSNHSNPVLSSVHIDGGDDGHYSNHDDYNHNSNHDNADYVNKDFESNDAVQLLMGCVHAKYVLSFARGPAVICMVLNRQ